MTDRRQGAKWIWTPDFRDHDDETPGRFVLFRKTAKLSQTPTTPCLLRVSADTRYRLYVNGEPVLFGPCKSYPDRWYYETIDVQPFLRQGVNIISAKVLRFFADQIGSTSLMKANIPGFILWGQLGELLLITDETWLCKQDNSISLKSRSDWNFILGPPFLSLDEKVDLTDATLSWQDADTDTSKWSSTISAYTPLKMMPALEPWKLYERPIPLLPETPASFERATESTGCIDTTSWNAFLSEGQSVSIPANEFVTVDFESSVLTTAFFELELTGGSRTEITILYAEGYEKDLGTDRAPFPLPRSKVNRQDYSNGRLYGTEDHLVLGTAEGVRTCYEPFWFRTFRYVQLRITTKSAPVVIDRVAFRETHYPLDVTTSLQLDSQSAKVWNICLNTLRNCMHETYEDCPFYEQNQFAMDGRLQLLFTYQLSRDDRLARKTIHEFHASRRDDGLLQTNFPVSFRAISIPQFSLYWILMLHDHMLYFGDASLVQQYLATADGILTYFDRLLNSEGLVGVFDSECWAFVDWVKEWQGTKGIRDMAVPPIYKKTGVAAYNSLIYALTLLHAAELCDFRNRKDTALEYRTRANSLNVAVTKHCFNGTYFTDGPGTGDISEHTQVFAILAGTVTGPDARNLLQRTMEAPANAMPRCSFAMKHYLFRALEKTGLYDQYFDKMMKPWHAMIDNNLTTCPEDDVSFRSDCHGWSASPIYEFVAVLHGIRPVEPGFKTLVPEPRRSLMDSGDARFELPRGTVQVSWAPEESVQVM